MCAEARAGCTAEYGGAGFSSVEHDVLVKYGNAFEFLRIARIYASLAYELDIISYRDRIEPAVELYGIDAYRRSDDLGVAGADYSRTGDKLVSASCEVDANILKAVAVAAGIKDPVCLNADIVSCLIADGKSAICHRFFLLIRIKRHFNCLFR